MATKPLCSIEECEKPAYAQGLCNMHWQRKRRHGDPLKGASREGQAQTYLVSEVIPFASDDCLIWPFGRGSHGYGQIRWGNSKKVVSNVVCREVHGEPPEGDYQAAHSCGNGHLGCVNPRHLSWKTRVENMADCLIHGTHTRGEQCGTSKLTRDDVRKIRSLSDEMTHAGIAKLFGVSQGHVTQIIRRQKWAWLD